MCLIAMALEHHPRYPLVVVANRDEHHLRPAKHAHWWPGGVNILAGKDLQAGGTWMGVNTEARWAAITNYREGVSPPAPRTRGELPIHYLAGGISPQGYLDEITSRAGEYGGFSLLLGKGSQVYYFSNRSPGLQKVSPGIHTLGNHLLDTPWPKAELARLKLSQALRMSELPIEDLLEVLASDTPFEDHELPVTGVGIALERVLSPPFIKGEDYGTRCTSVLLYDRDGTVTFAEQSFLPQGRKNRLVLHEFTTKRG